jgi:hypothetical protein
MLQLRYLRGPVQVLGNAWCCTSKEASTDAAHTNNMLPMMVLFAVFFAVVVVVDV